MRTSLFSTLLALAGLASSALTKCGGDNCGNAVNKAGQATAASAFCSSLLRTTTITTGTSTVYETATTTTTLADAVSTEKVTSTEIFYTTEEANELEITKVYVTGTSTEWVSSTITSTVTESTTASTLLSTIEKVDAVTTKTDTETTTV